MKVFNDYLCRNGHQHEYYLPMGQKEVSCQDCGKPAERVFTPLKFALEGVTGHFPTALQKWEARHKASRAI